VSIVVAFAGALIPACGGTGIAAPTTIAPNEDTGSCPSGDAVLTTFQARLDDGTFDPLRPHVEQILVEERGIATLLTLAGAVLPELDDATVPALLGAVRDEEGRRAVGALRPTLLTVLAYLDGSSVELPGDHDDVIGAAHAIVSGCDLPATIAVLRDLLALQVRRGTGGEPRWVRATPSTATSSWVFAFLDAARRAGDNPTMSALLEGIEITDDEGGGGAVRVGRDAFLVLARLLAANIAAPDFTLAPTRALLDDVLGPRLQDDPAARELLDELLDLFGVFVDPEGEAFPGVQEFMSCVDRHDHDAAIPGMLFDFLTTDAVPVRDLLADTVDAAASDTAGALREALVQLLDATVRHPAEVGDTGRVLGRLLEPAPANDVLAVAVDLQGTGVLTEVVELVDALLSCKGVAP
jgi:hypothetical protein